MATVERRYPEVYELFEQMERKGRFRMTVAPWIGIGIGFLLYVIGYNILADLPREIKDSKVVATAALGGISLAGGYWAYRHIWDRGFRMMVGAQRILVQIDTEQNTRQTVELLKELLIKQW